MGARGVGLAIQGGFLALGDDDHGDVLGLGLLAKQAADLKPIHVGKMEVEEDKIGRLRDGQLQGQGARLRALNHVPCHAQVRRQQLPLARIALDDQQPPRHGAS